jgi:hypothetical protein
VSTRRPQRYAGKENENASNIDVNIKSRKQLPLSPLKQQSLHHTNVQSKKQKLQRVADKSVEVGGEIENGLVCLGLSSPLNLNATVTEEVG